MSYEKFKILSLYAAKLGIRTIAELCNYKEQKNCKTNDELFSALMADALMR